MNIHAPIYLTELQIWVDLLPVPIFAVAISAGMAALIAPGSEQSSGGGAAFRTRWLVLSAFSLLGFVVGDLTGQSHEPAVSATIGAVLTLLAAAMVYLVGAKGAAKQQFVAGAVCLMMVSLFFGTNWGSVLRAQSDFEKLTAAYRFQVETEDVKLAVLRRLNNFPPKPAQPPAPPAQSPGNDPAQ